MIAVDTNILVYAHRRDSRWHEPAALSLERLSGSKAPWAIPWPCIHEFLAIVTHPRIYQPASTVDAAIDQVDAWLESPSLLLLNQTESHWATLRHTLHTGQIVGPKIHDARVAALCLAHGVRELWSADRDFSRFPDLRTTNPLLA